MGAARTNEDPTPVLAGQASLRWPPVHAIAALRLDGTLGWRQAVWGVTAQIPRGSVLSYGDVAAIIGAARAARQVGWALAALSPADADDVPWWRVLRTDGSIALQGDPVRGTRQAEALRAEGVAVIDMRVDMPTVRWRVGAALP